MKVVKVSDVSFVALFKKEGEAKVLSKICIINGDASYMFWSESRNHLVFENVGQQVSQTADFVKYKIFGGFKTLLRAIHRAVELCVSNPRLRDHDISVVSDSKVVVAWVNEDDFGNMDHVQTIYDIHGMSKSFGDMQVVFDYRIFNSFMDSLAKMGSMKSKLKGTNNTIEREFNLKVAEEYKGLGTLASGLRVFMEQLTSKNGSFDDYVQQINAILNQVTHFEDVISMFDQYVSLLESKMHSLYQHPPT
ncbi:hypothetical protein Ddye_013215 [Dipteronia dyeriana]|uniref:RNase H type-1 domain-containing protein n=1 Tax=Dipteronia dyeriana TaxID=168575 RepID=A0AAD9X5W6_9ROSI|nr:hypothetical protein Ddye_013215 [Dipteronia dyeriana]